MQKRMIHHKHIHRKIHRKLEKHSPNAVKKARKIFSFKYPKLILLIIMIISAYYLFSRPFMTDFMKSFGGLGNFGFLLSGALTSIGFTAPFGIGMLMSTISENILLAAIIGGIGGTLVDLFIFKTVKFSFMDEFKELEKTKVIKEIKSLVKKNKHVAIKHYLLYIFAGILLATPLPDELGISMLAGLTTIKPIKFSLICFFLHSLFILGILML
jgi:hypothetical protein